MYERFLNVYHLIILDIITIELTMALKDRTELLNLILFN